MSHIGRDVETNTQVLLGTDSTSVAILDGDMAFLSVHILGLIRSVPG